MFEYQQGHSSFHQWIGSNELEIGQKYFQSHQVCDFEFLLYVKIFMGLISMVFRQPNHQTFIKMEQRLKIGQKTIIEKIKTTVKNPALKELFVHYHKKL